jgi:two-component system, NarL family, sensor histidine kinase UhpB
MNVSIKRLKHMSKEINSYRLLVIEDNRGDYVLLQQYLQLSKLPIEKIFHAESMGAVPALAVDTVFDIALLDLTLPDSTGVDSVITLTGLLPKTPIVVLSGLSTIKIAIESISLGAQDYLVKREFDEKLLAKSVLYSIERKRATEKLRESNELYEFVNKATHDTIWDWDYLTKEGRWGDGIMETFGYSEANRKYNENWLNEYIHPEDKERVMKNIIGQLENGLQNWQDEFRFRCADGTYKFVKDRGFILYDNGGKPYRMIGAMTDITYEVQEEMRITKATIDAQEQERGFIGAELHDNINQILVGTLLTLDLARSQQTDTGLANGLIETAMGYIKDTINETRKLSHQLAPTALCEISLKEMVENLLMIMNLDSRFTINFKYDETTKAIPDDDIRLNLYRILQEQIRNIVKYSEAAIIEIAITVSEDVVMMRIFDNGRGFDTALAKKGIGLGNIKKRAQSLSGNFILNSAPGKGCEIIVEIPLNGTKHSQ